MTAMKEIDHSNGAGGGGTASADDQARRVTLAVLEHAGSIARKTGASAVFVYLDALVDPEVKLPETLAGRTIFATRKPVGGGEPRPERIYLRVPDVPLTRMGQIKIAIFLALSRNLVRPGDVVVCLAGIAESGSLDTVMVTQVGREFEMYSAATEGDELPADVGAEVLERVLDLATRIGQEGREGKPVGSLFVLGDTERVVSLSRQLILNPFRGYGAQERNLLDPALEETVKELSTLDGAFIIRGDGVIETCGAYLKTATQDEYDLPRGLGARHHAAAAITSVTEALAVTVSESTGTVTVYRQGKTIIEIDKPHSTSFQRARFTTGLGGTL